MAQIKIFSNPEHKKITIITFIVNASLQNNEENPNFEEPKVSKENNKPTKKKISMLRALTPHLAAAIRQP